MNESLLSFYKQQLLTGAPATPTFVASGGGTAHKAVPIRASVQHVNECSHRAATGCTRMFRSKCCCYAVQDHECNPPEELLPQFAQGREVTLAQVYIAQGCHL